MRGNLFHSSKYFNFIHAKSLTNVRAGPPPPPPPPLIIGILASQTTSSRYLGVFSRFLIFCYAKKITKCIQKFSMIKDFSPPAGGGGGGGGRSTCLTKPLCNGFSIIIDDIFKIGELGGISVCPYKCTEIEWLFVFFVIALQ